MDLLFNRVVIPGSLCCQDEWSRSEGAQCKERGIRGSSSYDLTFYYYTAFMYLPEISSIIWKLEKDLCKEVGEGQGTIKCAGAVCYLFICFILFYFIFFHCLVMICLWQLYLVMISICLMVWVCSCAYMYSYCYPSIYVHIYIHIYKKNFFVSVIYFLVYVCVYVYIPCLQCWFAPVAIKKKKG